MDYAQKEKMNVMAKQMFEHAKKRLATLPEPEGQKFKIGARVRIADKLDNYMSHFPAGKNATVLFTYAHAFWGGDVKSYCLDVDGEGRVSWYSEHQLTLIEDKKMSFGGIKRDKRDIIFSHMIRLRANFTCEYCGNEYPDKSKRMGLHCSHFFGRRHRGTRWHNDNAFSLCAHCHNAMGENPYEHTLWVEQQLGSGRMQMITELAHKPIKYTKRDLEDIYSHLKSEYKTMLQKAEDKNNERIEFTNYH